jgi:hypothetical protein
MKRRVIQLSTALGTFAALAAVLSAGVKWG